MKSNIRLNRIRIPNDVPDMYNFRSFAGCDAFDVFSAYKICEEVKRHAEELNIDLSECEYNDLPKFLSRSLDSVDIKVKNTAENITADIGRRLGLIVYTVKTASEEFRNEYKRYSDRDWQIWSELKTVFLSGGLANGRLGEKLCYHAEALVRELDIPDLSFRLCEYPSYAQTVGCARMNRGSGKKAVLLDIGHTFVKRSIAFFSEDSVIRIENLPKINSHFMGKGFENSEQELTEAQKLHDFIVDTVINMYEEHNCDALSKHIVISIANNVENGKIGYGGCYYKLMLVSDEYEKYLSECLSKALEKDISVTLIHDGAAAAMCFAGEENSVMLALGTAFGVGFPGKNSGLKNISMVEIVE